MSLKEEHFTFKDGETFHLFSTLAKQEELHCHNCLELNYIEKGQGTYIIGGKIYPIEAGDIFVINNSEHHLAVSAGEAIQMTVLVFGMEFIRRTPFAADYLKPFVHRDVGFSNRISSGMEGYEHMLPVFLCMKKEAFGQEADVVETKDNQANVQSERVKESKMITEAAANFLLALLYRHYNSKKELKDSKQGGYAFDSMEKAFSYINEHFAEKITLEELAKVTSLSKTYLSKSFKKFIGQSLFEYIQQTRVQHAGYLLQTSQKSITQIALESGFETLSYFNRIFKKYYHISPGQFRKEHNRRLRT